MPPQRHALPARDERGKYPEYAWPGGYPLYYLDKEGNTLCAECASEEDINPDQETIACDIYYEGAPLACDDCGKLIESAYGDQDDDDHCYCQAPECLPCRALQGDHTEGECGSCGELL